MDKPSGLNKTDTIEDALKRADRLAGARWHSGQLCDRKDLRRIVLLAYEYRQLLSKYNGRVALDELRY